MKDVSALFFLVFSLDTQKVVYVSFLCEKTGFQAARVTVITLCKGVILLHFRRGINVKIKVKVQ